MTETVLKITPVPAPRQSMSDRWEKRKCVMKYRAFKDEIKKSGAKIENGDTIIFVIPFPKSYSKKKKAELNGQPHTIKPDIDNLCKALLDAVFESDSHIHAINLRKIWGHEGMIVIERKMLLIKK